jgi:hypothetical protein
VKLVLKFLTLKMILLTTVPQTIIPVNYFLSLIYPGPSPTTPPTRPPRPTTEKPTKPTQPPTKPTQPVTTRPTVNPPVKPKYRGNYTRTNLTTCQQDVFATALLQACQQVVTMLSFYQVATYKVVTHNLLTNC